MEQISATEYAPYYAGYVQQSNGEIISELEAQMTAFPNFLLNIPEAKHNYSYAPGKWSIKEVIGHIIDAERIMSYRAMRISRNDQTPLAGFEQNEYVANSSYDVRSMEDLAEEFKTLRKSNLFLFKSFNEAELLRKGTASGYDVSVRALLYIMSGHLKHHVQVLEERYL